MTRAPSRTAPLQALAFAIAAVVAGGCTRPFVEGIDQRAAIEAVAVLQHQGVAASRIAARDGAWSVVGPSTQLDRATAVLAAAGLPRRAVEVPAEPEGGGLVPSPDDERRLRAHTVARALESTLLGLEGVYDARVHVVFPAPARSVAGGAPPAPQASVVLVERAGGSRLPDEAVSALVLGAVEGLTPDGVSVLRDEVSLPPLDEAAWEQVGPFAVAADAAWRLRALLAALASLLLLTSVAAIGVGVRGVRS